MLVTIKVAEVSEFTPGAFIGELSFDAGSGNTVLPIYNTRGWITIYVADGDNDYSNDPSLPGGVYAMDAVNKRVFEVELDSGSGEYVFTNGNPILMASGWSTGPNTYVDNPEYFTSLGNITLQSSAEPNIAFAISGQDLGFTVDGNNVYLNDNWYFDKDWGDDGTVVDGSSGGGFGLGDISLSIAVSGDISVTLLSK